MNEYYEEADLLLSTSDAEGTPLAFMEAASFGCPIISTNVGSVADLIDNHRTGILCESNSEIIAKTKSPALRTKPRIPNPRYIGFLFRHAKKKIIISQKPEYPKMKLK